MVIAIELGSYANMFDVLAPNQEVQIMVIERNKYPTLRNLREEIRKSGKEIYVYSPVMSDKIYGYGKDMSWLYDKGFSLETINLYNQPKLTGRMIIEGVINRAKELGYAPQKFRQNKDIYQILDENKGRLQLYNYDKFKVTSNNQIKVLMGYDLRVIFLKDPVEDKLNFGLIVDIVYSLKDVNDTPLKYHDIISRFDRSTLREVRQIQRDLIPTGINSEVSRQRLIEDIIPFVEQLKEIELPCGLKAEVSSTPSRIIMGDDYESVW